MKKLLLALLLLISTAAYSQTSFYYYQGHKIYLNPAKDKMLITFNEDATDEQKLTVLANPLLQPFGFGKEQLAQGMIVEPVGNLSETKLEA